MKHSYLYLFLFLSGLFPACGSDGGDEPELIIDPVETGTFAKGADVSWVTEMEKSGVKFYNAKGEATECMRLMHDLGMNTIRLRVWVNPADGWCNKADVLAKVERAHKLGMRLMIDFHYSDTWADPGKQTKPAAWGALSFSKLKTAVADHTEDVLKALKDKGITPEWVQTGNETGNGMLWPDGQADKSMANYAALNNAGYDAVKSVFPEAKVIVHLQNGQDNSLYRWLFDGLKANGGKWDLIGMSLYPEKNNWQSMVNSCIANIQDVVSRYGTGVIICETGMPWDEAAAAKAFLTALFARTQALESVHGILYWEPEAYNKWNGYTLGAFDASGKPTEALDAFK